MEIFDLTNQIPSQEEGKSDHFSAQEVKGNPTWTQITVVQNRSNAIEKLSSSQEEIKNGNWKDAWNSFTEIDFRSIEKKGTITSGPDQVPVENSNSALSSTSRLTASIALPLPKNLTYGSSNDWSEESSGFIEKFIGGFGKPSSEADLEETGKSYLANRLLNVVSDSSFRRYAQNVGIGSNPYKEVFYGGVRFRTFQFNWELAPKSEAEAKTIERLLFQLELASHPEYMGKTDSSMFWIPDSFEIEFKGTNLPKLQRMVLTGMNIDYTQYGPRFIKDGYPAFIGVDLSFMEVTLRTKEEVRKSYEGRNVQEIEFS